MKSNFPKPNNILPIFASFFFIILILLGLIYTLLKFFFFEFNEVFAKTNILELLKKYVTLRFTDFISVLKQ